MRKDIPFAVGVRGVCVNPTLRDMHQFINVSQKALHIYWQFSAMSHAIHKIVSKRRCQSYFISRRSPHHGISKDSDLCASAHRCLYLCLCAAHCSRNFQVTEINIRKSGKRQLTSTEQTFDLLCTFFNRNDILNG